MFNWCQTQFPPQQQQLPITSVPQSPLSQLPPHLPQVGPTVTNNTIQMMSQLQVPYTNVQPFYQQQLCQSPYVPQLPVHTNHTSLPHNVQFSDADQLNGVPALSHSWPPPLPPPSSIGMVNIDDVLMPCVVRGESQTQLVPVRMVETYLLRPILARAPTSMSLSHSRPLVSSFYMTLAEAHSLTAVSSKLPLRSGDSSFSFTPSDLVVNVAEFKKFYDNLKAKVPNGGWLQINNRFLS